MENAGLVLMCYSQRYFMSDYCKDEAVYSKRKKKQIIPLRMQPNYKADGWLGIITAAPLGFDFSSESNIKANLHALTTVIKDVILAQKR